MISSKFRNAGLLAVAVSLLLLPMVSASAEGLFAGLVGAWNFNDRVGVVAVDSSGAGNNGMLNGSAFFATDAAMGDVLEIAGPSGEVLIPHKASYEPPSGTVEIWVKPEQVQNSDIVSKATNQFWRRQVSGGAYAYAIRITKTGTVAGIITNDDPAGEYPWIYFASRRGVVNAKMWNHIVLKWDNGSASIYLNGKLVAATSYEPMPVTGLSYGGTSPVRVAGSLWDHTDGNLEFRGQLSGLKIYSRPLSEVEIALAYSSRSAGSSKGGSKK